MPESNAPVPTNGGNHQNGEQSSNLPPKDYPQAESPKSSVVPETLLVPSVNDTESTSPAKTAPRLEIETRLQEELKLAITSPTRGKFVTLHRTLSELEYLLLTDRSGVPAKTTKAIVYHVKCSNCSRTSAEEGVDMRNFAPEGSPVPLWRCKDHHPPPTFRSQKE